MNNKIDELDAQTQTSRVQKKLTSKASWVDEHIKSNVFPGCAIAVHHDGEDGFLYRGRYDYSDGRKYDRKTLVDLASITKFEAVALMLHMLADQGKISFNDPVTKFLPHYTGRHKDEVTIFHLMTNSVRPHDTKAYQTKMGSITGQEIIDSLMTMDLDYAPGVTYDYNNGNSIIGGFIVEKVTDMRIEQAFKKMIAGPLGLVNTYFCRQCHCLKLLQLKHRLGEVVFRYKVMCTMKHHGSSSAILDATLAQRDFSQMQKTCSQLAKRCSSQENCFQKKLSINCLQRELI